MKKKFFSLKGLLFVTAGFLSFQACQKANTPVASTVSTPQQSQLMGATNAIFMSNVSESESFNDVIASADSLDSTATCAIVTFIPSKTVFPHQKIIDFGTGCTGIDGHTRKGKKIVTVFVDPKNATPESELSEVTFDNFYLDSINITGVVKSYLVSSSDPGPKVIKVVSEKSIFSPNGDRNNSNGTHYWTQTEGGNTLKRMDDVYTITGHAEGTETLDGATIFNWTSDVDAMHPVIKPVDCGFRTMGGLNITIHLLTGGDASFTEYLDYGDGSCDNTATLSINGGTPQTITLPILFWPLNL